MTGNNAGSNSTGQSVALPSVSGGGLMLPAPKVQMMQPVLRPDVFVADGSPLAGAVVQAFPLRYVKVTVPGIPAAVLNDLAGYAPQVELVRYVRRQRRQNASGGNGGKSGGFVHPSHGPVVNSGSFTHGGAHAGVGAAVQAIRPTEWPILTGADNIDVTQGILGFMCLVSVRYRDVSGNNANSVGALVPSHGLGKGRGGAYSRFPYEKQLSGAYFAFRLSIKDRSDVRGKRIWGPVSDYVYAGNSAFPFLPAGLDVNGSAAAVPNPLSDKLAVNFWTASRLP